MVNLFDPGIGLAAAVRFATYKSEYMKGLLIILTFLNVDKIRVKLKRLYPAKR